MAVDIYKKLAKHLDNLPGGFPPTESGVELRILRRLFTPEEAELALHVALFPEESKVIARRAKLAPEDAAKRLEEMFKKGLILRIQAEAPPPLYMAAQYVIGIWEFHVNDLDPELIRDMNEYIPILTIDLENRDLRSHSSNVQMVKTVALLLRAVTLLHKETPFAPWNAST